MFIIEFKYGNPGFTIFKLMNPVLVFAKKKKNIINGEKIILLCKTVS